MFKVIEDFPRYEINDLGVVRNRDTKEVKYTNINKQGYLYILFKVDGNTYSRKIHRLVAEIFLPPPSKELEDYCKTVYPYKVCVNHKDHDKLNNNVKNLEWCTHAENSSKAWEFGVVPPRKGELNGRSVLTESLVHEICRSYENGMMPKEAVTVYGISKQQATKIRSGHAWKHVWEQYNIKVAKRSSIIENR